MGRFFYVAYILFSGFVIVGAVYIYHSGLRQVYQSQFHYMDAVASRASLSVYDTDETKLNHFSRRYPDLIFTLIYNKDDIYYSIPSEPALPEGILLRVIENKNRFWRPQSSQEITEYNYFQKELPFATILIRQPLLPLETEYQQKMLPPVISVTAVVLLIFSTVSFLFARDPAVFLRRYRKGNLNFKQSPGIYLKTDCDLHIFEWNEMFQEYFGQQSGKNITHLVQKDERERVSQYFRQVISNGSLIDFECTLITPDEDETRWALRVKPYHYKNTVQLIITGDDISKRYHMELELRHERNRMHTYLNAMHTLLAITDRKGIIKEANSQFVQLLGVSDKQIIGKSISHFSPKKSHVQINHNLQMVTPDHESTISANFPLVASSGKEYIIDWRITSLASDKSENDDILLTGLDITESVANNQALKQANIQIREALHSAEQANQSKSIFLANMSHEIRTPMNGILGATELMLDQTINKEQKQYIDIIHSSSQALLNIINDILDLSKIEAGSFELERINFDLHQLGHDVYQLFSSTAKQKNIQIIYFYDQNLPRFWIGDPTRIRQILNNLLSNALKFTHEGRIDLRVYGEKKTNHQYSMCLQIKDTGIGIAPKKREQIFSAFQQADTSTSRKYGGTGLGLTICQHLAKAMNGEVTVDSELGNGSTFSLEIPLTPGEIRQEKTRTGLDRDYKVKVLLAEDNAVNSKIACKILSKLGVEVIPVENGEAALHHVLNHSYDLVLMDVNMPIMDGITAAEKIRELSFPKNQIPILALTANAMMEDKERCIQAGMNGFISKPIKVEKLIEELDNILLPEESDSSAD